MEWGREPGRVLLEANPELQLNCYPNLNHPRSPPPTWGTDVARPAAMRAMRVRVGIDLVHIPRMVELMEDGGFLERAFQPSELGNRRPEHLAGIFAAKEAFFKVLGAQVHWLSVEVRWDRSGRPLLELAREARPTNLASLDVTIAHDGDYAVATVAALLWEEGDDAPDPE